MDYVIVLVLLWPFVSVVLINTIGFIRFKVFLATLLLIAGYIVFVILDVQLGFVSKDLGYFHHPDVEELIPVYEYVEKRMFLLKAIVLIGATVSGVVAKAKGRSFIGWFLFGVLANFSSLLLLKKITIKTMKETMKDTQ